jgi:2'-hydroxyisoflavone reductase
MGPAWLALRGSAWCCNPRLYGPLKARSETEALTQYGEAATTIIRPSLIVGPGDQTDRFTYWPVRLARGGEAGRADAGRRSI